MRRKLPLALFMILVSLLGLRLAVILAQIRYIPDDNPEFYFTRLAYTENRMGGRRGFGFFGTMPIPETPYTCPEFGGRGFFPRQGRGWGTDYPGADCKFMGAIKRLTGMRVHTNPNVLTPLDEDLFRYPFLYAVEVGGMFLSDEDAMRLREYMQRGGFLHADDFWGGRQRANFEAQMRKVFPDRQMEVLPMTHPVFHTFFDVDEVLQIPNVGNGCEGGPTWEQPDDIEPRIYGISDDEGRLMMAATYNSDLGDAWEYMDAQCYPVRFSGWAYRMGLNLMIYAMSH